MRKPYIIAEIGINHNGSMEIAKKLIDMAKEAGCDAVSAIIGVSLNDWLFHDALNVGGEVAPLRCVAEFLADSVEEVTGKRPEIVTKEFPADRKKIDIGGYYCDDSRLAIIHGWKWNVQLRPGLTETVKFYHENLEHYT